MSRFIYCYAECRYVECRYAECRYAECRGAKELTTATKSFTTHAQLVTIFEEPAEVPYGAPLLG